MLDRPPRECLAGVLDVRWLAVEIGCNKDSRLGNWSNDHHDENLDGLDLK